MQIVGGKGRDALDYGVGGRDNNGWNVTVSGKGSVSRDKGQGVIESVRGKGRDTRDKGQGVCRKGKW
jgi:hypothetical protein